MQVIDTPRRCKHSDQHKYRVTYVTGLDHRPQSTFIICQSCYDKPHFSKLDDIISLEEIIN